MRAPAVGCLPRASSSRCARMRARRTSSTSPHPPAGLRDRLSCPGDPRPGPREGKEVVLTGEVHPVEREADLRLAVSNHPGNRVGPPVLGEERRVPVDGAEPRDGKGVGRDLPRKAETQEQVRLVAAQKRCDALSLGGDHDVEPSGSLSHEAVELIPVPPGVLARAEKRDRFVSEAAQHLSQPVRRRRHLGDQDRPHPRS